MSDNKKVTRKKPVPKNTDIVWIYSGTEVVTGKAMLEFLTGDYNFALQAAGIDPKAGIIPVMPWVGNRKQYIQELLDADIPNAVIVVHGKSEDVADEEIHEMFVGQALLVKPKERKYYLDTLMDRPVSWDDFKINTVMLKEFLSEFFLGQTLIEYTR